MLKRLWRELAGRQAPRPTPSAPEFVGFLTSIDAPCFLEPGQVFEADLASMRLRVGIPAAQLAQRTGVWLLPTGYVRGDPGCAKLGRARALVVGKQPVRFFTTEPDNARALIEWIESRARDQRLIVDFSDNLDAAAQIYSAPLLSEFQSRCLAACEATVPTHALRERLLPHAR